MNNGRKNLIIANSAIVVFAAMVGFFITLDVSPQIAFARLFIDAGLVIGSIACIMAFYKEPQLFTETIVHAIKSLKSGKFQTRLSGEHPGQLSEVVSSLNDLAKSLETNFNKQEEIKRNLREELLPKFKAKEPTVFEHSYHPELGPVKSIGNEPVDNDNTRADQVNQETPKNVEREALEIKTKTLVPNDGVLSNTLIDSKPPKEASHISEPIEDIDEEQDLGDLYERFIEAQSDLNLSKIDYPLFLQTIEKTKAEIQSEHHCEKVFFDVVTEQNQVALQPKIIR